MSKLYGRVEDINSIAKYLIDNYNKNYVRDNRPITKEELEDTLKKVIRYLDKDFIIYINNCDINIYWDNHIKEVVYNGLGEENNSIFFPTQEMQEEYRADFMYYIGDLLCRRSLDYMVDDYDVSCQFGDLIPLLLEYLYFKEMGIEGRFFDRNFSDIRLDAPEFIKRYNRVKKHPRIYSEDYLLRNTLLYLVPLSSLDALLQIKDKMGNDKDEIRYLLFELINNERHNREEIMKDRGIETFGFRRLRKEIDLRK